MLYLIYNRPVIDHFLGDREERSRCELVVSAESMRGAIVKWQIWQKEKHEGNPYHSGDLEPDKVVRLDAEYVAVDL